MGVGCGGMDKGLPFLAMALDIEIQFNWVNARPNIVLRHFDEFIVISIWQKSNQLANYETTHFQIVIYLSFLVKFRSF